MSSKHYSILIISAVLLFGSARVYSQVEKKYIRQGNREYDKSNFPGSEINYRKAMDKNRQLPDAVFNAGDALYRQNKYDDAGREFLETSRMTDDKNKKAASLYNLGNSMLKSNKIKESIDAYKGSLRLNPDNLEAKYNLAYAQDLLQKQEQQQQQNQNDQQQNKDQKNDQDNSEQQNSDQQQDQQQSAQENQEQQQQKEISEEDAERLLNALANDEKDIQEKVKLAKALKTRTKTVKNW